ncbi:MAG: HEAT repeat domain-containing protein [Myxococcota bacterium]
MLPLSFLHLTPLALCLLLAPGARAQGGSPVLRIESQPDGRVSASIRGAPLDEVLQAFSDATGVEIMLSGAAAETISVEFEPLPPDEAIRTILGARGSVGFYERDPDAASPGSRRLTEVWVFQGVARPAAPTRPLRRRTPTPGADPFHELQRQALSDADRERRRHALERLVDLDEKRAKRVLSQALLNDRDETVRKTALDLLLWYDEEAPVQALMKAALRDESPEIRRHALEEAFVDQAEDDRNARRVLIQALGDRDVELRVTVLEALAEIAAYDEKDQSVRQALRKALKDQDEKVRLMAVELLEEVELVEPLREAASQDSSPSVRSLAGEAVERLSED